MSTDHGCCVCGCSHAAKLAALFTHQHPSIILSCVLSLLSCFPLTVYTPQYLLYMHKNMVLPCLLSSQRICSILLSLCMIHFFHVFPQANLHKHQLTVMCVKLLNEKLWQQRMGTFFLAVLYAKLGFNRVKQQLRLTDFDFFLTNNVFPVARGHWLPQFTLNRSEYLLK